MCKDCAKHRQVNTAVIIEDALNPTGALLCQGSTSQEKFNDALRTALTRRAVVRIGNLQEAPNGDVSIFDLHEK